MNQIKAIGFDLFNTLIYADSPTLDEALLRLVQSLNRDGLDLDPGLFKSAHEKAAGGHIQQARQSGRETHNRFWISSALQDCGFTIPPDDPIISRAVENYFSAFPENCHLIPGTLEMLAVLQNHYQLGLLSNFTHSPAALAIIDTLELRPFFHTLLISGELGWRKPHAHVFNELTRKMGFKAAEMIYIGDDPEPDIMGAQKAGLNPVWMTFVHDHPVSTSPRLLPSSSIAVDQNIPKVSSWEEFLHLLEVE